MVFTGFLFGLLGSIHCIGMCGPIALLLPVHKQNPTQRFFQTLSYHLGRLFTYAFIGLLFALLGKTFYLLGFQQYLSIFTGVFMIGIIVFPKIFHQKKIAASISKMVFKIKNALGKELQKKNNSTFFTLGFLNGFLPCGLVYMAVLGALATASVLEGVLYMFLFGVGTIPLMFTLVYVANFRKFNFAAKLQKIIPVVVIFVGVLFIVRGLGLGIPFLSPAPILDTVSAGAVCK